LLEWEWKIIKQKAERIRQVTFVDGAPAVLKNEGNFLSLNGKPYYFLKIQNNFNPRTTEHFVYYSLGNCLSTTLNIEGSSHFFKPDWEKLSLEDDYPWREIDRLNQLYSWGYLGSIHQGGIFSFVPRQVAGEGTPTMDSRGRVNRWFVKPPLNSALDKEIQKEAYTMTFNQLSLHPGTALYYIYEELWHPTESGYDDQSLIQYQEWLRREYETVEKLNQSWGREYKAFEDIVQPTQELFNNAQWWQYSPEFVNFRRFRGWAQQAMVKFDCDLVSKLDSGHASWGAKGDMGTQSWGTGAFLDMFGWYSARVASSVARFFNKAAVCGGYMFPCEDVYLDGRKQVDHKPGPKQYLGKDEVKAVYNKLISSVFNGVKGFYNEWYDDGMQHVFHRTEYLKNAGPKNLVKHWSGQLAFFEPPAYKGPPVKIERSALYASAANKTLYRLGQLFLPAKPLEPKILMATTEESFYLHNFGEPPYADFEQAAMRLLKSSNVPADFLRLSEVKDLSKYKMIILGDLAEYISRKDTARVLEYVNKGGKLVIVNSGCFAYDNEPRRYSNKNPDAFPVKEFSDLAGYTFVARDAYHMDFKTPVNLSFSSNLSTPALKETGKIGAVTTSFYYEPKNGSEVFLKGDMGGKEIALGLINKSKNTAVIYLPGKKAAEEVVRPLSLWFKKLLTYWKIDERVVIAGVNDYWDMYAGCLQGDGYTLAAVCNLNEENVRKVNLKLDLLEDGNYAVMD
ncbi:MAG: alpha-amylase family protein, partial [Candidatus Firestonebacteria bacterium]